MKSYTGHLNANGEAEVYRVEDGERTPLPLRLDLRNHSPTGFQWGYGGSGPAQLALALLADHLGDEERAQQLYQSFKFKVIGRLPQGESWELTADQIDAALSLIAQSRSR